MPYGSILIQWREVWVGMHIFGSVLTMLVGKLNSSIIDCSSGWTAFSY